MNVPTTRNVWTTMISVSVLDNVSTLYVDTGLFHSKNAFCNYHIDNFPESILFYISVFPKFTPQLFFLYLLPPIILEAAYCLHNEHFFDNIRSILFFAVVGTVINFVLTGGLLIFVKVQRDRLIYVQGRPTFLIYFADHWPCRHRKLCLHCGNPGIRQSYQESLF